jgi:hypothetical protein
MDRVETDLFSNATQIVPQREEDPRPWVGPVASGNERLLNFVHEATHRWCFSSAVYHAQIYLAGRANFNAMALIGLNGDSAQRISDGSQTPLVELFGEAFRQILRAPQLGGGKTLDELREDLRYAILDDMVRLDVIQALYRPLAEGLALFAEYDALSRKGSRAWSPLPAAIAFNFAGPQLLQTLASIQPLSDENLAHGISYVSAGLLGGARLSPAAVIAKASLLMQPFNSNGRGYLPGYLTIKSLWRHLYRKDPRLYAESDLSLTYMRSYFLEDSTLSASLLAPSGESCVASANKITNAFQRRLEDFELIQSEDVAAFEEHLVTGSTDYHVPGLLRNREESERAHEEWSVALDAMGSGSLGAKLFPEVTPVAINAVNEVLTPQRGFITVCSVPITIEPDSDLGGIAVRWHNEVVLTASPEDIVQANRDLSADPSAEARLDIVVGGDTDNVISRAAVVSQGERLLSCTVWSPEAAGLREIVIAGFVNRAERIKQSRWLRWLATKIVDADKFLKADYDLVQSQIPLIVDSIYRDTALWHAADHDAVDHCADLMAVKGLLPLLGSRSLLRRTALLGLAASLNSYRGAIDAVFHKRGLDFADTCEGIRGSWALHGFPPSPICGTETDDSLVVPLI